jgi:hypothetical protein
MRSCSEFAQDYRQNPRSELMYFSWAQGFMTGLNVTQVSLKRPERDQNARPPSQQMAFIREFCDKRPLAVFADAVAELFSSLPYASPQSN